MISFRSRFFIVKGIFLIIQEEKNITKRFLSALVPVQIH